MVRDVPASRLAAACMGYITDLPHCPSSPAAVLAPASLHTRCPLISFVSPGFSIFAGHAPSSVCPITQMCGELISS
ncbi:hypothetical protein GQ607_015196 [Colletotrichum asianum]|uniref:Uncharacterized protein n=1 Tax=Colletotrichum asianum TaxID=702518 RepID=A0A8H3ZN29_9PEZI|nr:hypothetical protein GQ607_015196 [Colletotrichum asianum]